ncbi:hypothetical protein BH09ACT3_BH09ACT3_12410 [soil metagenome]
MTSSDSIVSLDDAKTHLSELGERAARGEEIVVTKHGKPLFRITALERPLRRRPGAHHLTVSTEEREALAAIDWFETDEQLARDFSTQE